MTAETSRNHSYSTMASLARQRLSSATKSAIRRFSTPISPLRVGVRALSASSPSGRIENKANGDKNANTLSAQEQQRINNDIPLTPLPEFATGNGNGEGQHDWSKSYFGLSSQAFSKEIAEILTAPLDPLDIEIKPGTSHERLHDSIIIFVKQTVSFIYPKSSTAGFSIKHLAPVPGALLLGERPTSAQKLLVGSMP